MIPRRHGVVEIVVLSGGLAVGSSDARAVRAVKALAPEGVRIVVYDGAGHLPAFRADFDHAQTPDEVQRFRAQLASAGGVLVVSSRTGSPSIEAALQWIPIAGELVGKPTAVLNTSVALLEAAQAHVQLVLTLDGLGARIVSGASLSLPAAGSDDAASPDPLLVGGLRHALVVLAEAARSDSGNRLGLLG